MLQNFYSAGNPGHARHFFFIAHILLPEGVMLASY